MKNILYKTYALGIGQIASILLTLYMAYDHYAIYNVLLRSVEVHLSFQMLLSLFLSYGLYHFVRVIKISDKMRKAAREQQQANSQRVEILIFMLLASLIFSSLFYTVPIRLYYPTYAEYLVYFYNSLFQLALLISVIGAKNHTSDKFIKTKQKYAGVGGVSGLVLFYIYYQLM